MHVKTVAAAHTYLCALQAYVNLVDRVLNPPVNAVPVAVPAVGSGPNGTGTAIETFGVTAAFSLIPSAAIATATAG